MCALFFYPDVLKLTLCGQDPGHYRIEFFGDKHQSFVSAQRGISGLSVVPPFFIKFENHGGPPVNMPDARFLHIHATLAGVLHMSGAGKFFDEILGRFPPSGDSPPAVSWEDFETQVKIHQLAQELPLLGIVSRSW